MNPAAKGRRLQQRDIIERFWRKVDRSESCWIWSRYKRYGVFWFPPRLCQAHRVSWELTYGPIPPGLHVLHRCDNPPCVNPEHLFLGTPSDNIKDAIRKGRFTPYSLSGVRPKNPPHGEAHWAAKLTELQVKEIRRLSTHRSITSLSHEFGMARSTIGDIIKRAKWAHVK